MTFFFSGIFKLMSLADSVFPVSRQNQPRYCVCHLYKYCKTAIDDDLEAGALIFDGSCSGMFCLFVQKEK